MDELVYASARSLDQTIRAGAITFLEIYEETEYSLKLEKLASAAFTE